MTGLSSKIFLQELEKLGFDMNSGQMQVFRAVLKAAGGLDRPVKYDEISKCLELITGKQPFTRAYIYRRLNDLLDSKLISIVDAISTPRTYVVKKSGITEALVASKQDRITNTNTEKQHLTSKLNQLKSVSGSELALVLHKQLVGSSSIGKSGVIEGVENVRSTIIREFADGAKAGDVVRILGHASTMAEGLGPGGVTELRIIQSGIRGVKVRGLLTPVGNAELDLNLMTSHLTPMIDAFEQATKSGNIQLKLSREPMNTYRIVSLNEDKMLLYLTHAKESDMAALVHREDNPGLINDAIRTFDELWETGIDVLELVNKMLREQKS